MGLDYISSLRLQEWLPHSPSIKGDPCFSGVLLQLVKGPSSEGVRTDEAGLPALPLVPVGQLGGRQGGEGMGRVIGCERKGEKG